MVSTPLKNISQNGKSSPNRGENKKYLKPPPRYSLKVLFSTGINVDLAKGPRICLAIFWVHRFTGFLGKRYHPFSFVALRFLATKKGTQVGEVGESEEMSGNIRGGIPVQIPWNHRAQKKNNPCGFYPVKKKNIIEQKYAKIKINHWSTHGLPYFKWDCGRVSGPFPVIFCLIFATKRRRFTLQPCWIPSFPILSTGHVCSRLYRDFQERCWKKYVTSNSVHNIWI